MILILIFAFILIIPSYQVDYKENFYPKFHGVDIESCFIGNVPDSLLNDLSLIICGLKTVTDYLIRMHGVTKFSINFWQSTINR